ncbi:MAG: hypothetical protein PUB42_04835 [Firmicutes bacterium]|nr:hypothetical protein [Bacillota bacterium]
MEAIDAIRTAVVKNFVWRAEYIRIFAMKAGGKILNLFRDYLI